MISRMLARIAAASGRRRDPASGDEMGELIARIARECLSDAHMINGDQISGRVVARSGRLTAHGSESAGRLYRKLRAGMAEDLEDRLDSGFWPLVSVRAEDGAGPESFRVVATFDLDRPRIPAPRVAAAPEDEGGPDLT